MAGYRETKCKMNMNFKIKPETPQALQLPGLHPWISGVTCSPSSALRETSGRRLEESCLQQEGSVFISEGTRRGPQARSMRDSLTCLPAQRPRGLETTTQPSLVPMSRPHPASWSQRAWVYNLALSLPSWDLGQVTLGRDLGGICNITSAPMWRSPNTCTQRWSAGSQEFTPLLTQALSKGPGLIRNNSNRNSLEAQWLSLPARAGGTCSISGAGRFHLLRGN